MLALLVDEDIAARLRRELRPATRERPICCRRMRRRCSAADGSVTTRRLCHARADEKSEKNHDNG